MTAKIEMKFPLYVGNILRDNDPRMPGRIVEVIEITDTHAICETKTGKQTRVRLDRIYGDGKLRKSGFDYVATCG